MTTKEELEELLKECDKEKLHLCGHVQPFGALIGIRKDNYLITYVSENSELFLHVKPESLLNHPLHEALMPLTFLVDAFAKAPPKEKFSYHHLNFEHQTLDIKIFDALSHFIIECESPHFDEHKSNDTLQCGIDLLKPPFHPKELPLYYSILLKGIFETIKYDRIMLYRFHDDWSGEVIAEVKKEGFGSYLGLRFPASDIPSIARQMYLKNPFRHIADTKAANIPILSIDETTPDLTYSDIRSVSPVHIEYMNNMGMQGSFSTPIIVFGELWGLIACHNAQAKYLCVEMRQACRTLAHSFAIGISSFFTNEKLQKLDSTDRYLNIMMEKVIQASDILDGFESVENSLMQLIACDGLVIIVDDHLLNIGDVLPQESLEILDTWFCKSRSESSFETDSFLHSALRTLIHTTGITAGVLAQKTTTKAGRKIRCYWFRNELKQEIAWAGNPDKPIIENAGARKLSPRRSFEQWIEIKSGYAKAWSRLDGISAMKFSKILYRWL